MSEYKKALETITNPDKVHYPVRDIYQTEYKLLQEAIAKAEKYDGIVEAEEKFLATVKGEKKISSGVEFYLKLVNERDEANKRCEELEEKVMQYESIRIEDVLTFEGTNGKYNNADYKCLYINALKRIEELEQQNKVLVDGVKALFNKFSISKDEINEEDYKCKLIDFRILDKTIHESGEYNLVEFGDNPDECNVDDYNKVKAMLEVVDEEI